jgi:hypothetical protein
MEKAKMQASEARRGGVTKNSEGGTSRGAMCSRNVETSGEGERSAAVGAFK